MHSKFLRLTWQLASSGRIT